LPATTQHVGRQFSRQNAFLVQQFQQVSGLDRLSICDRPVIPESSEVREGKPLGDIELNRKSGALQLREHR